ncbi:uncharacterized protein [Ptychodera flava]|uniref:uncharacterized protein n=1 Tax=Ptychodera flava TaxID=63121 RepID=UPI00396A1FBF
MNGIMGSKEADISDSSKQPSVQTMVVMKKDSMASNDINPDNHVIVETVSSPLMMQATVQHIDDPNQTGIYMGHYYKKEPADDWCLNSIAATLCFFPLGLIALYFSILTQRANRRHDPSAHKWSTAAHLVGIAGGIAGLLIMAALLVLKYKYDYL